MTDPILIETPLTTFADLLRHKVALRYGCLSCVGPPVDLSPHEACARFGYDMRLREVREAFRSRCKKGEGCALELSPSAKPWRRYRVK